MRYLHGLAPAPGGGAITVEVVCGALPSDDSTETHPVTIHADWSSTTVHDLEAERVVRALGGWCSCLHFVESIVPAFRHALHVMYDPVALGRVRGRWVNTAYGGCTSQLHSHRTLLEAVHHEISAPHALGLVPAAVWRVADVQLAAWGGYAALMWQARDAWIADAAVDRDGPHESVLRRLWASGVLPGSVADALAWMTQVGRPAPEDLVARSHFLALERRAVGRTR